MTKKIDQDSAGTSTNVVALSHNEILTQKFNELPLEKKREYLRVVRGSVRGTTGFFDMRYTAGMSDYVSFKLPTWETADVLIRDSWMYSDAWGGSDSSNDIVIHKGDELFTWGWVKYFETNKINRKDLDYQKILTCTFDADKNMFIVKVWCIDESTKDIQVKSNGKYEFEEELLGKLWVPVELLENEVLPTKEELSTVLDQEHQEFVKRNMYQRTVDILILQWGRDKREAAEKYMQKEWVCLNDDQKKKYIQYLFDGYNRWGAKDMKKVAGILETMTDKEYIKENCDKVLEKTMKLEKGEALESQVIKLWWGNREEYQTKKLEHAMKDLFWYSNSRDNFNTLIKEYKQDPKIWYQKVLERAYKEDTAIEDNKMVTRIAHALWRGKDEVFKEIFIQNIKTTKINYYSLKAIFDIIESRGYDNNLYFSIWPRINDNKELLKDKGLEIVDMLCKIKKHISTRFSQDFFINIIQVAANHRNADNNKQKNQPYQNIWEENITDYSTAEKGLILKVMADRYIQWNANYKALDIINWWLEDEDKIVAIIEYLLDKKHHIDECDILVQTLKTKQLLVNKSFQERIQQVYTNISNLYCGGKSTNSNNYCDEHIEEYAKYADKEIVQQYIDEKINEFIHQREWDDDYDFYFDHIATCLIHAWFDTEYIQNIIMKYIQQGRYDIAAKCIKWLGLKIDKVRVNTLVKDALEHWKIEEAEKIAIGGWLYSIWKKKLTIKQLENNMLDRYDAKEAIKACKLNKSYYSFVIQSEIDDGNIKEAVELAEKYDLLITEEQFQWYLDQNEQLKKADEEKKIQEKKAREAQAIEMMKVVLDGKIACDINYIEDQKYVLIRNPETGLQIASHNLEWHKDIVAHVYADKKHVVGWGRIVIDTVNKRLKFYGESWDFGKIAEEYNEVMKHIIKVQYPEFIIQIQ